MIVSVVFSDLPLVLFLLGRNLRDQLVHSDIPPQDIPEQRLFAPLLDGNYKCNGCAQRNGTYKCRSFKHPQTGKSIPIKGVITCSTKAVIYLITCPCGKNDVGKTKHKLKVRISEHRSTIRGKNFFTQLRPTSWRQAILFRLCVILASNMSPSLGEGVTLIIYC